MSRENEDIERDKRWAERRAKQADAAVKIAEAQAAAEIAKAQAADDVLGDALTRVEAVLARLEGVVARLEGR